MLKSNLNIDNRFSLIGIVASQPKRHQSPNGIYHCQFVLEHRSIQEEAGLSRQAWCKMPVQMSGNQFREKLKALRSAVSFWWWDLLVLTKLQTV